MSQPVARVGDPCSHGGTIIQGSPTRSANNKPVARVGDKVACSKHGVTTIVGNVATQTFADNKAVALKGSICACGATITSGSPDTFAS